MAGFQETWQSAIRRINELSVSQRTAVFLGAALIGGSVMWLAQWAATPERQPLLLQSLSPEEVSSIQAGLDQLGQSYKLENGRLMVPASANRSAILAQLQQMERMPGDVSVSFAELVKDANPWISEHDNLRRWNVALQSELNHILGQFKGVKSASVVLPVIERTSGLSRAGCRGWASPA